MVKARTNKVVCYIVNKGCVLVFVHEDLPLAEVGVQVPSGTIKASETPEGAAVREATEETGLSDVSIVRKLGVADYDISPYRPEVVHRHFFEMTSGADVTRVWTHQESDPEGGGEGPRYRCYWIPLNQAHVLAGGLSLMVGALTGA